MTKLVHSRIDLNETSGTFIGRYKESVEGVKAHALGVFIRSEELEFDKTTWVTQSNSSFLEALSPSRGKAPRRDV